MYKPLIPRTSGGPLVDERGTSETWEHIYLGGEAVGQVAVTGAASALRLLITDRMGRVRKISNSAGTPLVRYTWDAWGDSNGAFSATDATETPQPEYSWTLPGQRRAGFGITLNGWRALMPEIGQYTSPEPMHMSAAMRFAGPQAYSYAAARPFLWIDPNGEMILPADPSGLGSDWVIDSTHLYKGGTRYVHQSGWTLDYHPKGKGKPGGRNSIGTKPHWHLNGGEFKYAPGTEIDDPPEVCGDDTGQSVESDDGDEIAGNDYYRGGDCDVLDLACQAGHEHILLLPIFFVPPQLAPVFGPATEVLAPMGEAAWAY